MQATCISMSLTQARECKLRRIIMRTSANFDSVGLSTGKDIREIYETVDTLMTANVMRRLSKNTHLLADKWYEYAILQIDKADKENLIILRKALTEAKSIIVNDITQS